MNGSRIPLFFLMFIFCLGASADQLAFLDGDSFSIEEGFPRAAGNLCVKKVNFLHENGGITETILAALSFGNEIVKIYEFDGSSVLNLVETIDYPGFPAGVDYYAFDISFISLPIGPRGEIHDCLVVPYIASDDATGTIRIVDLETRNWDGTLKVFIDCFESPFIGEDGIDYTGELYHVADISTQSEPDLYSISVTETDPTTPIFNTFVTAEFYMNDENMPKFRMHPTYGLLNLMDQHHASAAWHSGARPYETILSGFSFSSFQEYHCISTCHNGGILIWQPGNDPSSRINVGQWGGWDNSAYPPPKEVDGERGDVHRAAVLNGANYFVNGNLIFGKLLFFSSHTMGFLLFDITDPENPNFVWQWDEDTPIVEDGGISVGWPGDCFGIAVGWNSLSNKIRLYLGNGPDGLRCLDLSYFLCPWSFSGTRNFDSYYEVSVDNHNFKNLMANDVRFLLDDGNAYIFTSWREHIDTDYSYEIGITVHRDDASLTAPQNSRHENRGSSCLSIEEDTVPFTLSLPSPNPCSSHQIIQISNSRYIGDVELSIFDLSGRLVLREMLNPELNGGVFIWDCTDHNGIPVSTGTYLIQAVSEDNISIMKSLVLSSDR